VGLISICILPGHTILQICVCRKNSSCSIPSLADTIALSKMRSRCKWIKHFAGSPGSAHSRETSSNTRRRRRNFAIRRTAITIDVVAIFTILKLRGEDPVTANAVAVFPVELANVSCILKGWLISP
jgi:hypothetical protein